MSQVWQPGYRKVRSSTILAVAGKKEVLWEDGAFCRDSKSAAEAPRRSGRKAAPRLDEGRQYPVREGSGRPWAAVSQCRAVMGGLDPSAIPACPAQLWDSSRTNLAWLVRTFPPEWLWEEPGLPGLSETGVRIEESPFFLFSFFLTLFLAGSKHCINANQYFCPQGIRA